MLNKTILGTGMVVAAALLLAGCSGADGMAGMGASGATGSSAAAAAHNDADVTFAQQMSAHHQQSADIAKLASSRGSSAGVKELANDIEKAQDPDLQRMAGWLRQWGATSGAMSGMAGMPGMTSDADLQKLRQAGGAAFDKLFVQLMTSHYQAGVDMANTELTSGSNADVKALAQSIVTTENAEIKKMQQVLAAP